MCVLAVRTPCFIQQVQRYTQLRRLLTSWQERREMGLVYEEPKRSNR